VSVSECIPKLTVEEFTFVVVQRVHGERPSFREGEVGLV
jgi:hypothetical protein